MNASSRATVESAGSVEKERHGRLAGFTELAGRILFGGIFLPSGLGKLAAYSATAAYMSSVGVSAALLPLVIATEVLGALAIILGWKTRIAAVLLAGFCFLTAIIFHRNFAVQAEMVMFLRDVSTAGAFLMLAVNGPGSLSIDRRFAK